MRQGRTMERKQGKKWKKLEQSLTSVPNSPCGLSEPSLSWTCLPVCTTKQSETNDLRGPMHLLLSKLCIHESLQVETP